MKIKLLTALFSFFVLFFLSTGVTLAATISFDPATKSVANDTDFSISVNINTENTDTIGADVFINFDSTKLNVNSITPGGFYPSVTSVVNAGQIEIHALTTQTTDYRKGTGTVANISFKSKTDSGSTTATFICTGTGSGSQVFSSALTNILTCGSLNSLTVSFSGSVIDEPTATPTPTATSGSGTNACGGTCGSHSNCNSNLFCYNGFCRNPSCASDFDCDCVAGTTATATAKATVKATPRRTATVKPKATIKGSSPTPQVFVFVETPLPSEEPLITDEELIEEEPVGLNNRAISMLIGAAALILFLIGFALVRRKKKVVPPVSEVPSVFPQNSWPAKPQDDNPPFPSAPTFGPSTDVNVPAQPTPPVEPINPPTAPEVTQTTPQTPIVPPTPPQEPPTVY